MGNLFVAAAQNATLTLFKPGDGAPAGTAWFLLNSGSGNTDPQASFDTLDASWKSAISNKGGCYLFFDTAPTSADDFLTELSTDMLPGYPYGVGNTYWPRFAWRTEDSAAKPQYLVVPSNDMNQIGAQSDQSNTTVSVGRWQIVLGTNSNLKIGADGNSFVMTPQSAQNHSLIVQFIDLTTGTPTPTTEAPNEIDLKLSGAGQSGQLSFSGWNWNWEQMNAQFGGEIRMFQEGATPTDVTHFRAPVFYGKPPASPTDRSEVPLSVHLNPLAPGDPDRSRMVIDTTKPSCIQSRFVIGTTGQWTQLTPKAPEAGALGPGFAFQVSPDEKTPAGDYPGYYLAPAGAYTVSSNPDVPNANLMTMMCGVSGTEFVLLGEGDELHFMGGNKAMMQANGFDEGSPYTTSWMKVARNADKSADGTLPTSYCAQSTQSAYFNLTTGAVLPEAVGVSLVPLGDITWDEQPPVPMTPYAGFYGNSVLSVANPNAAIKVETVTQNESAVISPQRRSLLKPHFNSTTGPIFFSLADGVGFDGGFVRTPVGLLAQLNAKDPGAGKPPAGSIKELFFASSPQNPDQVLALNAPAADQAPVVNPHFTNQLMSDNVFMVATDPANLEPWANEIQLGDFTFKLDVGAFTPQAGVQDKKTILLFKFVTGVSLQELVNDQKRWTFLGGANAGTEDDAQTRINDILAAGTGPLFDEFNTDILNDKSWTGILALNCGLDYSKLPSDIQMLLGGMDPVQELRAHHFGVTINRVQQNTSKPKTWELQQSSLFAIIKYEADPVVPANDFKFQLLKLDVSYKNSKLVTFQSRIAMSIKKFFKNDAKLVVAPPTKPYPNNYDDKANGTIEIEGQYIEHEDGTGTLIFDSTGTRVFELEAADGGLRVVKSIRIKEASLSPTHSIPTPAAPAEPTTIDVGSAFQMDCLVYFNDSIGGDLFSYGEFATAPPPSPPDYGADDYKLTPEKGLYVSGYAITMHTIIDVAANTATLDPAIPTPDYTGMGVNAQLSDGRDSAEAKSLAKYFPNSINDIIYVDGGKKPTAVGAWRLQGKGITATTDPVFCLDFEVPLGNLGGLLSDSGNLFAHMYLGWTPGGGNAADSVGAVFVLPASIASASGFRIEGLIDTDFKGIQIEQVEIPDHTFYALRFLTYQGAFLNVPLFFERISASTGSKDLALFGRPAQPSGANPVLVKVDGKEKNPGYPKFTAVIEVDPKVFLGRALKIETDFTNPDPIDDAIEELISYPETLDGFAKSLYAGTIFSSGDAGIAFALKLSLGSFEVAALLHDDDFYGLKIGYEKEEEKKKKKDGEGGDEEGGDSGGESDDGDKKGGLLGALKGFEFMILYRKINDNLGVYSGDIYLSFGKIDVGSVKVELPDLSVSVWTNGDWRFSIGWPLSNHPLTVYVQAGAFPLVFKAGFYLAKLRGADNPGKFGDFALIWSFGAGLEGGLAKKIEKGPFSAKASLTMRLTVQGFLGSCDGNMTDDGVDYQWFAITLSAIGAVSGKVDFKIIVIKVSLTLTFTIGLAIETGHKTVVSLTFNVKAKASIKIIFVTISFSFTATVDLGQATFGKGDKAKLSGPQPPATFCAMKKKNQTKVTQPLLAQALTSQVMGAFNSLMDQPEPVPRAMASRSMPQNSGLQNEMSLDDMMQADYTEELEAEPMVAMSRAAPQASAMLLSSAVLPDTPVEIDFLLQATAIVQDDLSGKPQGVATLLITASDTEGKGNGNFGTVATAINDYLMNDSGWATGATMVDQLANLQATLQTNPADWVENAIAKRLPKGFAISGLDTSSGAAANQLVHAGFPMHPSLDVTYNKKPAVSFGSVIAPAGYSGENSLSEPITALVFEGYFQTMAKEIVRRMIDILDKWPELPAAQPTDLGAIYAQVDIGEISGLVSRFLMGGTRLPDPDNSNTPTALYLLTRQQFDLDTTVLTADLGASNPPSWITFAKGDAATAVLDPTAVAGLKAYTQPNLTVDPVKAVHPVDFTFPLSHNQDWTNAAGTAQIVSRFSRGLQYEIENYSGDLWLKLGSSDGSDSTTDISATDAWTATPALQVSISLKQVRDPADTTKFLPTTYAMAGTDEVNRAFLQALLEDASATLSALDLLVAKDGALVSLASSTADTGKTALLVKGNFSTATAAAGLSSAANADDPDCPTHANMTNIRAFLQLVWECSVVHTDGFYLDIPNLDPGVFGESGSATLMLLTQLATAPAPVVKVGSYINALAGVAAAGQSLIATLASDAGGTAVQTYAPSFEGGSAGWQINWTPSSTQSDAASVDYLQTLYHMFAFKVSNVSWTTPAFNPEAWSDPVNAQHENGVWTFQDAFPVAPLMQASNRYAGVGDNVTVEVLAGDVFGNVLPATKIWKSPPLDVVYNDNIVDPGSWPRSSIAYMVKAGAAPTLELQLSFDTTVGAEVSAQTAQQMQSELDIFERLSDQLAKGMTIEITTTLAASGLGDTILLPALRKWVAAVIAWYKPQVASDPKVPTSFGSASPLVIDLPLDKAYPHSWAADLTELAVNLSMTRDAAGPFAANAPDNVKGISASISAQKKPPAPELGKLLNDINTKDTLSIMLAAGSPQSVTKGAQLTLTSPTGDVSTVVFTSKTVNPGDTSIEIGSQDFVAQPQPMGSVVTVINPAGLTQFAQEFETAYKDYTAGGQLKVAEGVNADLTSTELGLPTIWVTRLKKGGATIKPDASTQNYYLPPPLSTRLITGQVTDVTNYSAGIEAPVSVPVQTFNAVDMDKWAAEFLRSLEEVFGPVMAPPVAKIDTNDPYGSFASSKTGLASSIAGTLADIFVGQVDGGRKKVAQDTFEQFLLKSLENDYGTSAVAQVEAEVNFLAGEGEQGVAPQAYGGLRTPAKPGSENKLPYSLSNMKVPMATGTQLMNFLVSARDPGAQKYFQLDPLFFQMTAMEHFIRVSEERCGYVPSQWLSFVLKDAPPVPDVEPTGALTTEVGSLTVPVPLRAFPPRPLLIGQTASQTPNPSTIAEAMTWNYSTEIGHPQAAQDSMMLAISFNVPLGTDGAKAAPVGARGARLKADSGTLFDALARYQVAYPALAPVLADPSSADFEKAVSIFTGLAADVRNTWSSWTPPPAPDVKSNAGILSGQEIWSVRLDEPDIKTAATLEVRMKFNPVRPAPSAPAQKWPEIVGYTKPTTAPIPDGPASEGWYLLTYKITDPASIPPTLKLSFGKFWVKDFQSANTSAWIYRNFELAPPEMHKTTNGDFVYTSEIVQYPNPVVPLNTAANDIVIGAGAQTLLDATQTGLLQQLLTQPAGSFGTTVPSTIATPFEGSLGFGYELMANLGASNSVFLPLYLLQDDLDASSTDKIASLIQSQMVAWKDKNSPEVHNSNVHLQVTLFADRLMGSTTRLPVVKFKALSIPVKDTKTWWGS